MTLLGGLVAITEWFFLIPLVLYFLLTAILGSDPIYHFILKKPPIDLPEEEIREKS